MREPETETIDGVEFRCVPMDARTGLRLETRLLKALGANAGILERVMSGKAPGAGEVLGLLSTIHEDDLLWVVDELGKVSEVRDDRGEWSHATGKTFERTFRGKSALKWKWIAFGLRVQLSDFFGESANG